jgi:hypothetical protein
MNADEYDEVSGYSEPSESEHDFFVIGHTSTSVSLASGLAKARDLKGETGNVIAVIGDGSLSGGEAFEGLNVGAELGTNFIVIVNDNQMSIAENHGGLYRNLQQLRETEGQAPCNYFKAMGYDYLYVKDGNDVEQLIEAFREVKDKKHPVVVHINTLKGKGYKLAEEQKERFHYSVPFDLETGNLTGESGEGEDYADLTAGYLLQEMKKDPTVVGITAGTPTVFGFTPERRKEAGRQFIDMGIAEGDYLAEGGTIVNLADLSSLWAEAQVYSSQMALLQKDSKVTVYIPDLDNLKINGKIDFTNPEISASSRINLVRISVPNKGNLLKPGMPVYVLVENKSRDGLSMPVDAVIRDGKSSTVWVKTAKNTFVNRMVETGLEYEDRIEITSGIKAGDEVVVSGAYLLNSEYIFKKGVDPMAGHDMSTM